MTMDDMHLFDSASGKGESVIILTCVQSTQINKLLEIVDIISKLVQFCKAAIVSV